MTGASQGIGEAVARLLARQGARVVLAARNEERLKRLAAEIDAGDQLAWQRDLEPDEDLGDLGAPDAVGRSVTFDGVPFTIVGVTRPEFSGPEIGRIFDAIVPKVSPACTVQYAFFPAVVAVAAVVVAVVVVATCLRGTVGTFVVADAFVPPACIPARTSTTAVEPGPTSPARLRAVAVREPTRRRSGRSGERARRSASGIDLSG